MVAYLVVMAYVVLWMFGVREELRVQNAGDPSQVNWETWRDDVRQQQSKDSPTERGPVARKVPKSTVPPIYVLMDEHFVTMLIAALTAGSFLFALLVFAVKGVVTRVELPADSTGPEETRNTPSR